MGLHGSFDGWNWSISNYSGNEIDASVNFVMLVLLFMFMLCHSVNQALAH